MCDVSSSAVPRVALRCCPSCHSKATWNQGSSLLGVQRFDFLPSTTHAPTVHQHSSLYLELGDFVFYVYPTRSILFC